MLIAVAKIACALGIHTALLKISIKCPLTPDRDGSLQWPRHALGLSTRPKPIQPVVHWLLPRQTDQAKSGHDAATAS